MRPTLMANSHLFYGKCNVNTMKFPRLSSAQLGPLRQSTMAHNANYSMDCDRNLNGECAAIVRTEHAPNHCKGFNSKPLLFSCM